jgi:integrase
MSRPKQLVPQDIGNGDYCYFEITTERKPVAEFVTDEQTGEVQPKIKKRNRPTYITFPILVSPDGINVFEANLFTRHLARNNLQSSTLNTHVRALLLFYRWMKSLGKTIYDCFEDQENGVVYLFRDFLLENLKVERVNEYGEKVIEGIYQPSTAKAYTCTIIRFFTFLHVERVIRFSQNFIPFEYYEVSVARKEKKIEQDKLAHIKPGDRRITITTTGLTKPFGLVQSVESHHKLAPMREDEKQLFYSYLSIEDNNFELSRYVKDLMFYTATETGLRAEELTTFPISEVKLPLIGEEFVSVTISKVRNGCETKFDKERTVEVPAIVMNLLVQYKFSKARTDVVNRCSVNHNALFLNPRGGLPFKTNTLETYFQEIREKILMTHPEWYFTIHDLRATFATHWLYREHSKRGILFDLLLDELAELMGHDDPSSTEKYIKYMKTDKYWKEFATRKNNFISNLVGA